MTTFDFGEGVVSGQRMSRGRPAGPHPRLVAAARGHAHRPRRPLRRADPPMGRRGGVAPERGPPRDSRHDQFASASSARAATCPWAASSASRNTPRPDRDGFLRPGVFRLAVPDRDRRPSPVPPLPPRRLAHRLGLAPPRPTTGWPTCRNSTAPGVPGTSSSPTAVAPRPRPPRRCSSAPSPPATPAATDRRPPPAGKSPDAANIPAGDVSTSMPAGTTVRVIARSHERL